MIPHSEPLTRSEVHQIIRRVVWAFFIAFVAVSITVGIAIDLAIKGNRQACQDRRDARDAVRTLVVLALGETSPAPSSPIAVRLHEAIQPGGALEQIRC